MMEMMNNMMSNPMVQQMMQNPDFMKQAAQMMGGGAGNAAGGLGGMNPQAMQQMMQNPSMSGLLDNIGMIETSLNMLTDPKNKAMRDMIQQQNPSLNVDMMAMVLKYIVKLASTYKAAKKVWSNVYVRLTIFALIILLIAYYFG